MQPDGVALALARFGLGPRPGDTARFTTDPRALLNNELNPKIALLNGADLPTSSDAMAVLRRHQLAFERARRAAPRPRRAGHMPLPSATRLPGRPRQRPCRHNSMRRNSRPGSTAPASADIGFVERLVAFWTNHFAIGAKHRRRSSAALAGAFEREAIRPHVLGRFEDMLFAVDPPPGDAGLSQQRRLGRPATRRWAGAASAASTRTSPARSWNCTPSASTAATPRPTSRTRQGADRLEHVARRQGPRRDRQLPVPPSAHEPGPQTIMGKVYDQPGEQQGIAVIADLAARPATARHIATKLARAFVADDPPPALVERLAGDFRHSGGDLLSLSRTLVDQPRGVGEPRQVPDAAGVPVGVDARARHPAAAGAGRRACCGASANCRGIRPRPPATTASDAALAGARRHGRPARRRRAAGRATPRPTCSRRRSPTTCSPARLATDARGDRPRRIRRRRPSPCC